MQIDITPIHMDLFCIMSSPSQGFSTRPDRRPSQLNLDQTCPQPPAPETPGNASNPCPRAKILLTAWLWVLVWLGFSPPCQASELKQLGINPPRPLPRVGNWATASTTRGVAVVGSRAYIADGNSGFQIVDISTPASPKRIGGCATTWAAHGGVSILGNRAFVADVLGGIEVIDITTPSNPQRIATVKGGAPRMTALVGTNYLLVADEYQGILIMDITNTAEIHRVGGLAKTNEPNSVHNLAVSGKYAYLADEFRGLMVVDIANPPNPQLVTNLPSTTHARGVAVGGNYVYVTDYGSGLAVVDVTTPANARRIATLATGGAAYDVAVDGNYAYIADGNAGLTVVDISIPSRPRKATGYATPGFTVAVKPVGGLLFVADAQAGLSVLDATQLDKVGFRLQVTGQNGQTLRVQRSADLRTWEDLKVLIMGSTAAELADLDGLSTQRAFYRVISP